MSNKNGSKWIRQEKRVAIVVIRDGGQCVYCGSSHKLTLDHIKPRIDGGSHEAENLVTACQSCNSKRGSMDIADFVQTFEGWELIADRILRQIVKPLDVKAAVAMLEKQSCRELTRN